MTAPPSSASPKGGVPAARVRVEGVVQGVGFRPHVHRLAGELGLSGTVRNDGRGVVVEVEGDAAAVDAFVARVGVEAPPLAVVERVVAEPAEPSGARGFAIVASEPGRDALVAPDSATCDACLAELFDPADRRYRYPFVNCTDCGPRFTIVAGVPYDRERTTMAGFAMCAACRAEYEDPADRRFHAEPNACPDCGPRVRGYDDAVARMRAGGVVAVKGLGGYHVACLATDEDAVAALRARKHREDRPFALMAGSVAAAGDLVVLGEAERALLTSRERPIVLARRKPGACVAAAVAPRSRELGVMLPYSPLHHLLLADAGEPIVLTSGNVSDEPIAYRDDDARERLAGIADAFVVHDRPIHMRTDDSVVRAVRERPLVLRRSRGHVPRSTPLPVDAPPLLACGAELKSTFCVARGRRAWVGHHIGDLKNLETLEAFREGIAHFERLFAVTPEMVAHDLHPQYLSTAYALEREGVEHVAVQHHHAHLAAVLAEHGETGPAVGAIYDGTGHGTDGTVWGGELLAGDLRGFERAGHLHPVRLPGGDQAVRQPWRMACAWLVAAGLPVPPAWEPVARLARTGFSAPVTTSMGRLFDAVAALCGVCARGVNYEGQAAVELEALADDAERGAYPMPFAGGVLDARETIRAAAADAMAGVDAGIVSARFHRGLARASARTCQALAEARGLDLVVLSGGVFQNRRLLTETAALLDEAGLRVLIPEHLPPNDAGIAYGQAAVAAARG